MKKIKRQTATALIRVVFALAAYLFIAASIFVLPVTWGIVFSAFGIISLAVVMQATERKS